MKNILFFHILIVALTSAQFSAQQKKKLGRTEQLLTRINPEKTVKSWALIQNVYGKDKELKTSGTKNEFLPQFSGFDLVPDENSYYYIAYTENGTPAYIQSLEALKTFLGKTDSAEEAALKAILDGYFVDEEFSEIAANYWEDAQNYYLEMGRITSAECPYQKSRFILTVDKKSGETVSTQNSGSYMELYSKKCSNNPRLQKAEVPEPQKEPVKKKQPVKKRK